MENFVAAVLAIFMFYGAGVVGWQLGGVIWGLVQRRYGDRRR